MGVSACTRTPAQTPSMATSPRRESHRAPQRTDPPPPLTAASRSGAQSGNQRLGFIPARLAKTTVLSTRDDRISSTTPEQVMRARVAPSRWVVEHCSQGVRVDLGDACDDLPSR